MWCRLEEGGDEPVLGDFPECAEIVLPGNKDCPVGLCPDDDFAKRNDQSTYTCCNEGMQVKFVKYYGGYVAEVIANGYAKDPEYAVGWCASEACTYI